MNETEVSKPDIHHLIGFNTKNDALIFLTKIWDLNFDEIHYDFYWYESDEQFYYCITLAGKHDPDDLMFEALIEKLTKIADDCEGYYVEWEFAD